MRVSQSRSMRSSKYFLTWPQNDETKETVLLRVRRLFDGMLKYAVVCQELHVDGNPHLHAIIVLKEPYVVTRCDFFDQLTGRHGNYQSCRSPKKVLEYVCKDGNYISFGVDVKELLAKKGSEYAQCIAMLMEGKNLTDIFKEFPGSFGRHYSALHRVYTPRS